MLISVNFKLGIVYSTSKRNYGLGLDSGSWKNSYSSWSWVVDEFFLTNFNFLQLCFAFQIDNTKLIFIFTNTDGQRTEFSMVLKNDPLVELLILHFRQYCYLIRIYFKRMKITIKFTVWG